MPRPMRRPVVALAALPLLALGACGQEVHTEPQDSPSVKRGAVLFNQRCSGCHTLGEAAASGSKPEGAVKGGERTNGPNFDERKETTDDVLFAIRNGGFSGAIMPANIVVGQDANDVAQFVCRYAGGYDDKRDCTIKPPPPPAPAGGGQQGTDTGGQQGGGQQP
jgi:mono/diheme cytochrome c family protein